jgi:hypothetical protein
MEKMAEVAVSPVFVPTTVASDEQALLAPL